MPKPILGYWDIRGYCECIRNLLRYKGIDFEDKRYLTVDEWQNEKAQLNLDFPNLPYFIDDDFKLSQSMTILRYLARKHNLAGKTEEERVRAELAEQQLIDMRNNLCDAAYSPAAESEKRKADLVQNSPAQFKLFSAFLGNRKFIAGDNITYVDFLAYDIFDFYHLLILPTLYSEYPNLKAFQNRIEKLPELQKSFQSATFKRWNIFQQKAQFGGKGQNPNAKN